MAKITMPKMRGMIVGSQENKGKEKGVSHFLFTIPQSHSYSLFLIDRKGAQVQQLPLCAAAVINAKMETETDNRLQDGRVS